MDKIPIIPFEALVSGQAASLVTSTAYDQQLPLESLETGNQPRQSNAMGAYVQPTMPSNPRVLAYTKRLATELGLETNPIDGLASLLSGSGILQGTQPFAMNYAGHQFGHWAGQLGDGRAINLFELETPIGRRSFQLKGAGPTPFSRGGDGLSLIHI